MTPLLIFRTWSQKKNLLLVPRDESWMSNGTLFLPSPVFPIRENQCGSRPTYAVPMVRMAFGAQVPWETRARFLSYLRMRDPEERKRLRSTNGRAQSSAWARASERDQQFARKSATEANGEIRTEEQFYPRANFFLPTCGVVHGTWCLVWAQWDATRKPNAPSPRDDLSSMSDVAPTLNWSVPNILSLVRAGSFPKKSFCRLSFATWLQLAMLEITWTSRIRVKHEDPLHDLRYKKGGPRHNFII